MYTTDFVCTYQLMRDEEDSLLLYQFQFLQAFNLQEFSDDIINKTTEKLYEEFKENFYIKELMNKRNKVMVVLNKLELFRSYFGYDTFNMFHILLCSLINNEKVNEENYEKLINL